MLCKTGSIICVNFWASCKLLASLKKITYSTLIQYQERYFNRRKRKNSHSNFITEISAAMCTFQGSTC
jgi:hypothetical protein